MVGVDDNVCRSVNSITDENDWCEFSLTDVKVLKPGKMLYANLLDATAPALGSVLWRPVDWHRASSRA
jgi:hypothetical protein